MKWHSYTHNTSEFVFRIEKPFTHFVGNKNRREWQHKTPNLYYITSYTRKTASKTKVNPSNINCLFFFLYWWCAFVFKSPVYINIPINKCYVNVYYITLHRLHPCFSMQINITCFTSVWWFFFFLHILLF